MIDFILYLWQLPQNIVGLLVILFTRAKKSNLYNCYVAPDKCFGVTLGNYIIFGSDDVTMFDFEFSIKHEQGHQIQSRRLGLLYLILVGIPSITCNIYNTLFHKTWTNKQILEWYYSLPWEKNANKLSSIEWKDFYKY